jgi:phosphoribosylanthranilate isomerase
MKIKVCGLKQPENIKAVAALKPDYMGFICYDRTPRYIDSLSSEALEIIPINIHKTGVFVNETIDNINARIEQYGFDTIQLHGDESPEFAAVFKGKVTVIKAFGVDNDFDFGKLNAYVANVNYFMFDTKTSIYGGSGKAFNWGILNNYTLNIPFFLSGGISLDNIEEVKNITHPQFYAVDLNSRFEDEPGLKNIQKLEKAFDIIKNTIKDEIRS